MIEVKAETGSCKVVALVRSRDGHPQFDDFDNIPEVYHSALTEDDWVYINEKRVT